MGLLSLYNHISQFRTVNITLHIYCCFCAVLNCVWLCDFIGYTLHEISQARTLEWVAISLSRGSYWSRDQTRISCIGRWILYHWAIREAGFICIYSRSPWACMTAWAPPPVRSAAALDSHGSMNPMVKCTCGDLGCVEKEMATHSSILA